jgi:polynucleotide 5'-hydroxyl-kinase GRC3/NOL9
LSRAAALEAAAAAPVTLVLGAGDTGKTTLVAVLASDLLRRGHRVGLLDADLGQSEIGPPTTIGLGEAPRALARPREAEVRALAFVGVLSPAGDLRATLAAAAALAARARAFDRVVVDTCGLIAGRFGVAFKRALVEAVRPDVVIALERGDECRPLLAALARAGGPPVVRVPAAAAARRRSARERAEHRRAGFDRHFAGARALRVPVEAVEGATALEASELVDRVVGALDAAGETLGLGRIVETAADGLTVETAVPAGRVARFRLGRARVG